jgi:hypothetical protein
VVGQGRLLFSVALFAVVGCSAATVQRERLTDRNAYLERQIHGRERLLEERFRGLSDVLAPGLAKEADIIADGWHSAATGDVNTPPCEEMRAAYQALGEWLRWQSALVWADPTISAGRRLDGKIDWVAKQWLRNDECSELSVKRTALRSEPTNVKETQAATCATDLSLMGRRRICTRDGFLITSGSSKGPAAQRSTGSQDEYPIEDLASDHHRRDFWDRVGEFGTRLPER